MGRRLLIPFEAQPHPILPSVLLVAWAAASMAVMLSLCATCLRKATCSKQPSPSPSSLSEDSIAKLDKRTERDGAAVGQSLAMAQLEGEKFAAAAAAMTVIELAPDVATHGPIGPTLPVPSPSTKRKLSMSFSMGLPDALKGSRRERKGGGGGDSEDSVWKKTIILGEKCKVEDEEEEVTVVDENGNRRRNYHQRMRQTTASRDSSFAYTDRDDRESSVQTGAWNVSGHV